MSNDEYVLLEDEYLTAAETIRANAATRKRLDAEDERAKEILRKRLADGETGVTPDGEPVVKIKPGAFIFDQKTAADNLPATLLPRVTVTRTVTEIDKVMCKELLGDALYRTCCKQNKSSVVAL